MSFRFSPLVILYPSFLKCKLDIIESETDQDSLSGFSPSPGTWEQKVIVLFLAPFLRKVVKEMTMLRSYWKQKIIKQRPQKLLH